jgi:hypothetical protein
MIWIFIFLYLIVNDSDDKEPPNGTSDGIILGGNSNDL